MTAKAVKTALAEKADPERACFHARFFKTGPGEYAQGDKFLGVTVPHIRTVAKQFRDLSLSHTATLLTSKVHEHRLCALIILVEQFKRAEPTQRKAIFDFYLKHIDHVDNWDLVDGSAPTVVGEYLLDRSRARLDRWAKARSMWRRRIAIMATLAFIRRNDFADTLRIADTLLNDKHDLIHKAVGWMLREVGNRDRAAMEAFLKPRYATMPRTMLRYAIEKIPEARRKAYLAGKV